MGKAAVIIAEFGRGWPGNIEFGGRDADVRRPRVVGGHAKWGLGTTTLVAMGQKDLPVDHDQGIGLVIDAGYVAHCFHRRASSISEMYVWSRQRVESTSVRRRA